MSMFRRKYKNKIKMESHDTLTKKIDLYLTTKTLTPVLNETHNYWKKDWRTVNFKNNFPFLKSF